MFQEKIAKERLTSIKLSEVWFVHDYVRLVFGSCWLDLNSMPTITNLDASLSRNDIGYCDGLCKLIESAVADVSISSDEFKIMFEGGVSVRVSLADSEYVCPEMIVFGDGGQVAWVL